MERMALAMANLLNSNRVRSASLLRLSALAILALGIIGLASGSMPPVEAGRFYLIAFGLYMIAPSEALPRSERSPRRLLRQRRYAIGVFSITCAVAIIVLQFVEQTI